MKKTLLITLDFPPQIGGVANYYFNLCQNLDKDKIVVLTQKSTEQNFSFKVYYQNLLAKLLPKFKWLIMISKIKTIARQEKIAMLWAGEILPTGTAVMFVAKRLKIPYIVSCHGNDILQASRFKNKTKLAVKILKNAQTITANSAYTKKLIIKLGIKADKIKVIYPGIEIKPSVGSGHRPDLVNNLQTKYNLADKKILLSVGRLVPRKGFDKVIASLSKVWEKFPDLIYIIAGDGPDRSRLEELIGESNNIIFLGQITEEDKNALLDLCDIFITPARQTDDDVEGFGIVYLEAGQFSKPVIAGNVGGAPEAVLNNQTGLLVNPENTVEISEAIIKLLKNEDLRIELGKAGQERSKDFHWQDKAEELAKILS